MIALRELFIVSRLACASVCVRACERAVGIAKADLARALASYDQALADLRQIEHQQHDEQVPGYLRKAAK